MKERAKYGNHKIKNAFGSFDSELEWGRYLFLLDRQKNGKISGLKRQVEYQLLPAQYRTEIVHLKTKDKEVRVLLERSCSYIADFVYERNGKVIVEDCKGSKYIITADFKIKKKLMLWVHQIQVKIISSPTFWDK